MEEKQEILNNLLKALQLTRAGRDIAGLRYAPGQEGEVVYIVYVYGGTKVVNVAGDSGAAMIRDVMKYVN